MSGAVKALIPRGHVTVLAFPTATDPAGPWASGEAACRCGHKWVAVAPLDPEADGWVECPSCLRRLGRFVNPFGPKAGEEVWTCCCGCQVFYFTREHTRCVDCGNLQAGF